MMMRECNEKQEKCTALEAANYLLYLTDGAYEDMTNMKLNKLLYYAQGYSLKQTGHVLFSDEVEAWEHGPAINSVYQKYKNNGDKPITTYDSEEAGRMPKEAIDILLSVAREYGRYNASTLRGMTHVPKSPWDKYYVAGASHVTIPVGFIKEYFDKNEKEIQDIKTSLTDEDYIGYRDSEGYLVLPKEFDDETI